MFQGRALRTKYCFDRCASTRIEASPRAPSVLHRKEVIQPLVLERLPCYDFTPITKPTFGRVLHCWLDYGLRVFPALMV